MALFQYKAVTGKGKARTGNLDAANIAFNLIKTTAGDGLTVGPLLLGAARPVHILTPTATVRRIVNMTALTVVDAV